MVDKKKLAKYSSLARKVTIIVLGEDKGYTVGRGLLGLCRRGWLRGEITVNSKCVGMDINNCSNLYHRDPTKSLIPWLKRMLILFYP